MFEWLFGGAFVALHACARYCTPTTNRYSTTFFQFYFFLIFYVVCLILIYGFFGWILDSNPEILPRVIANMQQVGIVLPDAVGKALGDEQLAVPILLALLLTTLLPSIPKLRSFDTWLREHFWRLGNIPDEAEHLASSMAFMPYEFPPEIITGIEREAASHGIPREHLVYQYRQDASYGWPFATALCLILRNWKADGRGKYSRFAKEHAAQFAEVERIHDHCTLSAKRYLSLPGESGSASEGGDAARREELIEVHDQLFHVAFDELVLKAINLIAQGVLFAKATGKERAAALADLGFTNTGSNPRVITPGHYAMIFAIIVFGLVCIAVAEGIIHATLLASPDDARPPMTAERLLFTALLTSAIFAAAVLAVDFAKALWRKRGTMSLRRQRPLRVAATAGLAAVLFWLCVALSLRAIKYVVGGVENIHPLQLQLCELQNASAEWLGLRVAWCDIEWSHPYLLQSAAIAVAIAMLATYWPSSGPTGRAVLDRMIDGLITAVAMALVSVVVYFWLEGFEAGGRQVFEGTRDRPSGDPLALFVLKGALMAFVIGYILPALHRKANRSTALQRIRAMLADDKSARTLSLECDKIRNDDDLRQAFAAASALVVLAEQRPNGMEMEVLNQFWQMFGRRSFARFRGIDLRNDFQNYCRDLVLRLSELKQSGCATPGGNGAANEGYAQVLMQCLGDETTHLDVMRGHRHVTRLLITLCVAIAEADSQVSRAELEVLDVILARLQMTREDAGILVA